MIATHSAQQSRSQWLRLLLLLLILASFGWRIHHLDLQSLWRDEVDAVWFAMRDLPQTLSMFVSSGQNGPLYFLSLRPWLSIVGSSEFALRFPSVVAGTLSIPLLWQITRHLTGANRPRATLWLDEFDGVAWVAALLLASNPYQLWYSQEGKMYAIVSCLSLFATWFWLCGLRSGGWRNWLAYLITVSLSIYCHLLMILLIPLHIFWFLIAWPQAKFRWRGYGLALAGLTLPYLPMVWWQWDLLMAQDKRTGFNFTPLSEILKTLGINHSFGFAPHLDLVWLSPLIFLAFAGLLLGWEQGAKIATPQPASFKTIDPQQGLSAWRCYLLILSWLIFPILEIYILSLRQPVFTDRYIFWIAASGAILIALGANSVRTLLGKIGSIVATLLVCFVVALWINQGWQQKSMTLKFDLRAAVQFVSQQRSADSLLILQIPHTEWAYRYYSGDQGFDPFAESDTRLGYWVGGLWTNGGVTDADALRETEITMPQMTSGFRDIWVIFSEATMWDERRLMDQWLDKNTKLLTTHDFYGIQVRHYQQN